MTPTPTPTSTCNGFSFAGHCFQNHAQNPDADPDTEQPASYRFRSRTPPPGSEAAIEHRVAGARGEGTITGTR